MLALPLLELLCWSVCCCSRCTLLVCVQYVLGCSAVGASTLTAEQATNPLVSCIMSHVSCIYLNEWNYLCMICLDTPLYCMCIWTLCGSVRIVQREQVYAHLALQAHTAGTSPTLMLVLPLLELLCWSVCCYSWLTLFVCVQYVLGCIAVSAGTLTAEQATNPLVSYLMSHVSCIYMNEWNYLYMIWLDTPLYCMCIWTFCVYYDE